MKPTDCCHILELQNFVFCSSKPLVLIAVSLSIIDKMSWWCSGLTQLLRSQKTRLFASALRLPSGFCFNFAPNVLNFASCRLTSMTSTAGSTSDESGFPAVDGSGSEGRQQLTTEQLQATFGVSISVGLTEAQASARLNHYGLNRFKSDKPPKGVFAQRALLVQQSTFFVLRDGKQLRLRQEFLVPGDIVTVQVRWQSRFARHRVAALTGWRSCAC